MIIMTNEAKGNNLFDFLGTFERNIQGANAALLFPILLKPNTTYTFSTPETNEWNGSGLFVNLFNSEKQAFVNLIDSNAANRYSYTFTTTSDSLYYVRVYRNNIESLLSKTRLYQLEEGSIATEYEPFKGYKIYLIADQEKLMEVK